MSWEGKLLVKGVKDRKGSSKTVGLGRLKVKVGAIKVLGYEMRLVKAWSWIVGWLGQWKVWGLA